jgi:hypothetical protein
VPYQLRDVGSGIGVACDRERGPRRPFGRAPGEKGVGAGMRTRPTGVRTNGLVGLLAVAAALLVGCPTEPVPLPPSGCVPGASTACVCAGGAPGGQVCAANRTFGPCQCGDAGMVDAGPADAGTTDIGAVDVGLPAPDVGSVDAPTTEVGAIDGGSPADAGSPGTDVLPAGCVSTTIGNCCGVSCSTPPHATPACVGGSCGVGTCLDGYADCDGNTANGCECKPPNAAGSCTSGSCAVRGCFAGFGDCDHVASNGCESVLASDAANCGACGASCATGRACVSGACVQCTGSQTPCEGACADTQTNALHCGGCGRACPTGQSCVSGTCRTVCNLGEGALCAPDQPAPACCTEGRACFNAASIPTTGRCVNQAGGSCSSDRGCILQTTCVGGRCCYRAFDSCRYDAQCCSGLCGRRTAGVCDP